MTGPTVVDVRNHVQVRTYRFNYTYTFYTIEHALEHFGFHIRYSNIGEGRILVHFDNANRLIENRTGHMELRLEPDGESTLFKLYSSYYTGMDDDVIIAFRRKVLETFQYWLDSQFTMTLPEEEGDIPRFRPENITRGLRARPDSLARPDTEGLSTQLIFLGTGMMLSGIIIASVFGFWSGYLGMQLAILSGLPFVVFGLMVREGHLNTVVPLLTTVGLVAGLIYIIATSFIGFMIIMLPVAVIYSNLREIIVWRSYFERSNGQQMGPGGLVDDLGIPWEKWDKTMGPRKGNGPGETEMRGAIIY